MFTGIIEEIGKVIEIVNSKNNSYIVIECEKVLKDTRIGDSISTNGVCLTVTKISKNSFRADIMGETLNRSNLGRLKVSSRVNLERALCLNSRLGGHIVSGHIDGIGNILKVEKKDIATWITIIAGNDILRYIVEKGSIAINGISLTVAYVDDISFKVSIIPHTLGMTNLLELEIVNLECDIMGKYAEKLINKKDDEKSNITKGFLESNGFM